MTTKKTLTNDELLPLKHRLWREGRLEWKLLEYQEDMYEALWAFIEQDEELTYCVNCSRRFGKTSVLLIIAIEFAIRFPHSRS